MAAKSRAGREAVVLLLGDTDEQPLLEDVKKGISAPVLVAAGLRMEVVCALLQCCSLLLCNDGGLLHLANALGVSTVSLYGPVDETVYGPYGSGGRHEVLTQAVPCRPCYQKFHFPPCEHQRRCLDELSVEKVSAALQKI
jgi:ADP-heptose:LPS heptosyltransferase